MSFLSTHQNLFTN